MSSADMFILDYILSSLCFLEVANPNPQAFISSDGLLYRHYFPGPYFILKVTQLNQELHSLQVKRSGKNHINTNESMPV